MAGPNYGAIPLNCRQTARVPGITFCDVVVFGPSVDTTAAVAEQQAHGCGWIAGARGDP